MNSSAPPIGIRHPAAGLAPVEGGITLLEEHHAITDAVQVYLDAARTGVPNGLRAFLRDPARVVGLIDSTFMAVEPDAFVDWVRKGGPSPSLRAHRLGRGVRPRRPCPHRDRPLP